MGGWGDSSFFWIFALLILAGGGVMRANAGEKVYELSKLLDAPIIC